VLRLYLLRDEVPEGGCCTGCLKDTRYSSRFPHGTRSKRPGGAPWSSAGDVESCAADERIAAQHAWKVSSRRSDHVQWLVRRGGSPHRICPAVAPRLPPAIAVRSLEAFGGAKCPPAAWGRLRDKGRRRSQWRSEAVSAFQIPSSSVLPDIRPGSDHVDLDLGGIEEVPRWTRGGSGSLWLGRWWLRCRRRTLI